MTLVQDDMLASANMLLCLAATLFMTGVIWVIQLVHYPLFAQVGAEGFVSYHAAHSQRITWVVLPAMLVEAITALVLVALRPAEVPAWLALVGLALVGIIWGSTFFLQVPFHNQLGVFRDSEARSAAIAGLVATNWVRTVAWSLRSMQMLAVVVLALRR